MYLSSQTIAGVTQQLYLLIFKRILLCLYSDGSIYTCYIPGFTTISTILFAFLLCLYDFHYNIDMYLIWVRNKMCFTYIFLTYLLKITGFYHICMQISVNSMWSFTPYPLALLFNSRSLIYLGN